MPAPFALTNYQESMSMKAWTHHNKDQASIRLTMLGLATIQEVGQSDTSQLVVRRNKNIPSLHRIHQPCWSVQ